MMKNFWCEARSGTYDKVCFSLTADSPKDAYYKARVIALDIFREEESKRAIFEMPHGDTIKEVIRVEVSVYQLPIPAYMFL